MAERCDKMAKVKVDIGVPCANMQSSQWWLPLISNLLQEAYDGETEIVHIFALHSALPDYNKNQIISSQAFKYLWNPEEKHRAELTDANRSSISKRFLDGDSDYLFFIDDDTVPPVGAITKLVSLAKPFASGLYFNPAYPHNPIAYIKNEGVGTYHAFWGYAKGALTQVDGVGMGCTLIHRSVFEKIMEEHEVFQRPDGSIVPIHKSRVQNRKFLPEGKLKESYVKDGYLHMGIQELPHIEPEFDKRAFPFFGFEYGRTEDLFFCELCANVGIRPWVDTTILCTHWKNQPITESDYEMIAHAPNVETEIEETRI
jgi:hypothetical protein